MVLYDMDKMKSVVSLSLGPSGVYWTLGGHLDTEHCLQGMLKCLLMLLMTFSINPSQATQSQVFHVISSWEDKSKDTYM